MPHHLLVSVKFDAPICVSCHIHKKMQILAPGGWLSVMGGELGRIGRESQR
jgi:hypothetical protein